MALAAAAESASGHDGAGAFIDGYSASSAASAVRAGIDVRLVQDHIPLRPHDAHAVPDPVDIKLDYETCVRTIDKGLGAPPVDLNVGPNPKQVHWFHIPKCGSSFGSTLYSLVCQKEPSPNVSPCKGTTSFHPDPVLLGIHRWSEHTVNVTPSTGPPPQSGRG